MCDIIHRRQYDIRLRLDTFFKYTSDFKAQEKLLGVIHGLTNGVIRTKKQEYLEKGDESLLQDHRQEKGKIRNDGKPSEENMRYVRDDLDEIDENDVGRYLSNNV